jgi:integrase
MTNYFLRRVLEVENILGELKAYFQERQKATERILASKTKKEPERDPGSNSYLLPDGMDPDYYIDMIENSARGAEQEGGADMPALKEGSITKRKDGRWMGRLYINGKQKAYYANSRPEIVTKLNEVYKEKERLESEFSSPKKMILSSWMTEWMKIYKEPNLRASSYEHLQMVSKPIFRSQLARKSVARITTMDIEKLLLEIEKPSMRIRAYILLNECLEDLVKSRIIRENPCAFVDKPKNGSKKEKTVPDSKDLELFFSRLKDRSPKYYLFAKFIVSTGLRRGEALALTWADIDFENKRIRIDKSFDGVTKKVSKPKTEKSTRVIPLFEGALEVLQEIGIQKRGDIFDIGKVAATNRFRIACQKIGFPQMNLHALRHIFATHCLEAGIEGKVVQKWLGHAKYDVTINVYSHINSDFEQVEIAKLNQFWRKKG